MRGLFLALFWALAGCASNSPPSFDEIEAVRARSEAPPPPLPFRAALARIELPPEKPASSQSEAARAPAALDPEEIRRDLAGILARHKVFQRTRLSASFPPEDAAEALAAGDDLLLRIRIRRAEVFFAGLEGLLYALNWANWWLFWASSWFIPDERYALEIDAEVAIQSVRSERTLVSAPLFARAERSLDDFERGLVFPGLPYLPGWIGAENLRLAASVVRPFALEEIYLGLLNWLDGVFRRRAASLFSGDGTTLSVSVGISRYQDYELHNLRFASSDAEAFHRALLLFGDIPLKNARILRDEAATAEAVRTALEKIASQAGPADEIVFYFAGYLAPGRSPVFVCFDTAASAPERGGVSLDEIVLRLEKSRARAALIVIDGALSGGIAGRSLAPIGAPLSFERFEKTAERGPAIVALTASAPGDPDGACEVVSLEHGLFTYYLVSAISGAADFDRNREISWEEAMRYAAFEVAAHAELEGKRQRPAVHGPLEVLKQRFREGGHAR
jgi:hypothetical protein